MNGASLLVFARCAGFVSRAPGFSHPSVPHLVRVGLAILIALAVSPGVHAHVTSAAGFVLAVAVEFLLGAAIGQAASLLYDGAYAGGRLLDDYVGVRAIAPSVAIVAPSGFGRVWSIAFTGAYFLLGGYRAALVGFADGFTRFAPGSIPDAHAVGAFAASLASTIVLVACAVAAPSMAMAFTVQVALAALSRAVPRFSSFSLSFPLVFAVVLVASALAIPLLASRAGAPVMLAPWSGK